MNVCICLCTKGEQQGKGHNVIMVVSIKIHVKNIIIKREKAIHNKQTTKNAQNKLNELKKE